MGVYVDVGLCFPLSLFATFINDTLGNYLPKSHGSTLVFSKICTFIGIVLKIITYVHNQAVSKNYTLLTHSTAFLYFANNNLASTYVKIYTIRPICDMTSYLRREPAKFCSCSRVIILIFLIFQTFKILQSK